MWCVLQGLLHNKQSSEECVRSLFYPVSFQCSQHLFSQLDLSRDLIDTVTAAQEWLEERGKRTEVEVEERVGKEKGRNCKQEEGGTHTYNFKCCDYCGKKLCYLLSCVGSFYLPSSVCNAQKQEIIIWFGLCLKYNL